MRNTRISYVTSMENDELFTNNMVLIVLSDEFETKDGPTCSEKDEYKMPIVINRDIRKFKETKMMY